MSIHQYEGILLVNKERNRTAFYLVKMLRKATGIKKIGHGGTLDPFATGVMVMLLGRHYTKKATRFLSDDKEYTATFKLGISTDTFDCDGTVTHTSPYIPSQSEVEETIASFQGEMDQIPPMYSAKKQNGVKLYHLARKGLEVARPPVKIVLKTTLINYTYPLLTLSFQCTKGTYIRALAHDIGLKLKTYGHVLELKRTRSGPFYLKDCIDTQLLFEPAIIRERSIK